jgi:type 1 glutamine amidotransferase
MLMCLLNTLSRRCVLAVLAALTTSSLALGQAGGAAGQPLRAHIIAAGEYRPVESMSAFKQHLEQNFRVECTASWGTENIATHLDNLDQLKHAELLLLFARRMKLPDEEMAIIRDHWQQGKAIVALRTACHAFQPADNEVFDKQVLGGSYRGARDYTTPFTAAAAAGQTDHPILKEVGPITSRGYYGNGKLADDAVVVQIIEADARARPVSWAHTYRGGRTFYTSMGVPTDFEDENFRRLLVNAVFWTSRREPEQMKK